MRHVIWILLGWAGVTLWTAVGSRLSPVGLMPDAAVVTVVFVALYREPIPTALTASALGYLCGRMALAPVGLHEFGLVACGVFTYLASGRLKGSGGIFFAGTAAAVSVGYHLLLAGLIEGLRGGVGFSSWATALLVPNALLTGLLALVSFPWMVRLERRLSPEAREGLSWQ